MENTTKLAIAGVTTFVIIILVAVFFPIVVIGPGERGVVFNNGTGIENRILSEGVHFRIPLVENVTSLPIKVQKNDVKAEAASADLQTVTADIVVNWHLDGSRVNKIYQTIGDEQVVLDKIINPAVSEVVKATVARKTAEEIIKLRPQLKDDIDTTLKARLAKYDVVLDDVSIVNIDFSKEFNAAIESKTVAEQLAGKAENDLKRIKIEAEQTVVTAKANAESIKIQSEALAQNQRLVDWEAVKKWNGVMPIYTGGGMPFLTIGK